MALSALAPTATTTATWSPAAARAVVNSRQNKQSKDKKQMGKKQITQKKKHGSTRTGRRSVTRPTATKVRRLHRYEKNP
jgi:hypothetical protein